MRTINTGIYQFGNSVHYEKPWNKGSVGKLLFTDIVNSLSRATGDVKDDNSGGLHEQLMDLLSNNTKFICKLNRIRYRHSIF